MSRCCSLINLFAFVLIFAALPLVAGAATVELGDHRPDGMTLHFQLGDLDRATVTRDGMTFEQLEIAGGGVRGAVGQPGLPTLTRLVAVPVGMAVTARVVAQDLQSLGTAALAPVAPLVDQGEKAPRLDAAWYGAAPRTEPAVTVGEPALLHGLRVVPVTFAPVGHDPATSEVTAAVSMTVDLEFAGRDDRATPATQSRLVPESFAALYEQMVVGWQRGDDVMTGPGSIVYVCPDIISVVNAIEPLVEWRRQQGYHVEVVTTGTTGDDARMIRTWLENYYAASSPPLEFVTIVGDANGSIAVPTFNESVSGYGGEGDHDYSRLDGDDVLSDVHVGRLSVQSITELDTVIDKILDYEREPDLSDTDWFTTAGLTGDPTTSGYSCIYTNRFFKQELLELGYTQVDTIWGGNFLGQMMATINQGETIFTYRGLGGMSGMNTAHIAATTNGRQLPYAVILTCDTGSFQHDTTARSEAFLRARSGGGIASIGTATIGTHTRYNNCMFLGIADHITGSGDFRFGPSLTGGKLNLYANYWDIDRNTVWTWCTWNNLMGDPATELWTGIPQALTVDHATTVAATAVSLPVTVSAEGAPVVGARVAVYQDGTVHASATTDQFGRAVLDIAGAADGDIHVTVTGHNLYPYRGFAAVGAVNHSLDLAGIALDGDGLARPGQSVELAVALINGGTGGVREATATLVGGNEWLTVDADVVEFGIIDAGSTMWGPETWTLSLTDRAPGGGEAVFELVAAGEDETWSSLVTVPVTGPRGDIAGVTWDLPGASPDPGEAGGLTVNLTNLGNLATGGVTGTLSCESVWVTVIDADGSWGAIDSAASADPVDGFMVAFDAYGYPGHLVNFQLDLAFAEGGTQTIQWQTTVGVAAAGDPTGPDAYGYYAFSDDDDDPLAPTYQWTDISQSGTALSMTDFGRYQDDLVAIDLPFPFVYYGQTYDRITVCSNGWLSFRETDLPFYRGWVLPAEGSPDAMVCAFWDDLANGEVYTFHDAANHQFVLQWNAFETWYQQYSGGWYDGNCTFQIILHDPLHSETDTGDGLITMQYAAVTDSADEEGHFAVGMQDHTRTVGLTYAFADSYAGGAAEVRTGRAIQMRAVVPQEQGVLQGQISNSSAGDTPIPGATVSLVGSGRRLLSAADGAYGGSVTVGVWDVVASHPSCAPDTAFGVTIVTDQATTVDFTLEDIGGPLFTGTTQLAGTTDTIGPYVVETYVTDLSGVADQHLYYTSSSGGGPFEIALTVLDAETGHVRGEIPGQPLGTRVQYWLTATDELGLSAADPVGAPWPCYAFHVAEVSEIVDTEFENGPGGWTIDADGDDTADAGHWELGDPLGTTYNGGQLQPEYDHTPSPGTDCWFTGQHLAGESAGYSDVDGGVTTLTSPVWNLSGSGQVTLSYWRWYTNNLGSAPGEDVWRVEASNDGGTTWADLENTDLSDNSWQQQSFALADLFPVPDQLRLRFSASDLGYGSLVEAAVDDLRITATTVIDDVAAPTVVLNAPNGGETFVVGQEMPIAWQATDDTGVVEARISVSVDGGQTFGDPVMVGAFAGGCEWTVTLADGDTEQARVRVEVLDAAGRVAVDESDADFTLMYNPLDATVPAARLALAQNQPNPFNPQTVIRFNLPRTGEASLRVFDLQGRLVRTLLTGELVAGRHEVTWRGEDNAGSTVASGTYFYRLVTPTGSVVRKMSLLK